MTLTAMTTIFEVCSISNTDRFDTFMAASQAKAEKHLFHLGFKDVTASGAEEYTPARVWAKRYEGNAFVQGELVIVVVKPFDRYID